MGRKRILITGASGQLGSELKELSEAFTFLDFVFTDKEELSIDDRLATEKYFSDKKFNFCINCAAYTAVDKAETERELATRINTTAVGNLARVCKKHDVSLIHISTDYVFNGNTDTPYKESDRTDPVNFYGSTKLDGELQALDNNPRTLIIRTSWLYSSYGNNFVKTMLRLMKEKEQVGVVNDQFGCPTYARDLAAAILTIIAENESPKAGVYHFCNSGIISWYDLASEIKKLVNSSCVVNAIPTSAYPTPAQRPVFSAFDCTKIETQFGLEMKNWKESLGKCIDSLTPVN